MPSMPECEWDIFISYSHEDARWVTKELYEPLKGCRTADGRAPVVFLDKKAIPGGANYTQVLGEAVRSSRHVVPVYSESYFRSDMCRFELLHAVDLDPTGQRRTTIPLLLEPAAAAHVPASAKLIHFIDCADGDWFEQLARQLELKQVGRVHALRFAAPIGTATVHETLPEVRVALEYDGGLVADEVETVQLFADQGALMGTRSAVTRNGVAVFADLFFDQPMNQTRLVATAPSCPATCSEPFAVVAPAPIQVKAQEPLIPMQGTPVFFPGAEVVAVLSAENVGVFDFEGQRLGGGRLSSARTRFVRRLPKALVLASWDGTVDRLTDAGEHQSWRLEAQGGLCVPGDAALREPAATAIGMWDGRVLLLSGEGTAETWFVHKPGVQAMAIAGEEVYLADFEGMLAVYRDGRLVERHPLERVVRALKAYPDSVVAAGRHKLHQLVRRDHCVLEFPLQFEVIAAMGEARWPVAIGEDGKGVFFDQNMTIRRVFHARAGAVPTSLDQSGTYCALANPDGSYSLLENNRVILHHEGGALAVSDSGSVFAVAEPHGIRIVSRAELLELAGKRNG